MLTILIRTSAIILVTLICQVDAFAGELNNDNNRKEPFIEALDSAFLMYTDNPSRAIEFSGELFRKAVELRNDQYIIEAGMLFGDFLLQTGDAQGAYGVFYYLIDSLDSPVSESIRAELKKRQAYCNFYMGEFRPAIENFF